MSATTEPPPAKKQVPELDDTDLHPLVSEYAASDTLVLLLAIRFLNAICVRTFFQPDEYFQSLEPAWQMAFGAESGAWITWEWHHQLRSSLHPALFAAAYSVVGKVIPPWFPEFRAMILSVMPNLLQGLIAAAGDYHTWRLAERIHGRASNIAWTALMMSIFSPWQWFCSTRTFSNSLETTLTIVALNFWPWEMVGGDEKSTSRTGSSGRPPTAQVGIFETPKSVNHLRISLLSTALACILRPSNILFWLGAVPLTLFPTLLSNPTPARTKTSDYLILLREAILCGTTILLISSFSDRLYFGEWTFPPYHWFTFNITQDLAIFYGSMPFHYYISQGLPLLLTTYLPFVILSLFQSLPSTTSVTSIRNIRFILNATVISTLSTFSLIAHKEVRFIYPLLPILHILIAPTIDAFFTTTTTTTKFPPPFPSTPITTKASTTRRGYLKTAFLLLNIGIAYYVTRIHQAGVIAVMPFLRTEYERLAIEPQETLFAEDGTQDALLHEEWQRSDFSPNETFVGFLMPCHSTPWRSQLVYPGLKAWALSCEPPLHIPARTKEREMYRDEADRFYDDPVKFLTEEINTKEKPWPRYIVGFEGIKEVVRGWYEGEMKGFVMREKWRGRNSHWHDDKRRQGDVVVWEFVDGSNVI